MSPLTRELCNTVFLNRFWCVLVHFNCFDVIKKSVELECNGPHATFQRTSALMFSDWTAVELCHCPQHNHSFCQSHSRLPSVTLIVACPMRSVHSCCPLCALVGLPSPSVSSKNLWSMLIFGGLSESSPTTSRVPLRWEAACTCTSRTV